MSSNGPPIPPLDDIEVERIEETVDEVVRPRGRPRTSLDKLKPTVVRIGPGIPIIVPRWFEEER